MYVYIYTYAAGGTAMKVNTILPLDKHKGFRGTQRFKIHHYEGFSAQRPPLLRTLGPNSVRAKGKLSE